jgi:hypothetical protein
MALNACFSIKIPPTPDHGNPVFHTFITFSITALALYATMVLAVADSYFQVGGRTPTVL